MNTAVSWIDTYVHTRSLHDALPCEQRKHPALHRPAVQEHQRRAFARFLDAGIVVHAPRSVRNARVRGRLPALRRPTRIANATIPSTTSTAPHTAMPRGPASCRNATPMAVEIGRAHV